MRLKCRRRKGCSACTVCVYAPLLLLWVQHGRATLLPVHPIRDAALDLPLTGQVTRVYPHGLGSRRRGDGAGAPCRLVVGAATSEGGGGAVACAAAEATTRARALVPIAARTTVTAAHAHSASGGVLQDVSPDRLRVLVGAVHFHFKRVVLMIRLLSPGVLR